MDSNALVRTVVCDDEPDAREGIVSMLSADPTVLVVGEARNGSEAVDAITSQVPDLVFLDVQMPRLDGFGVIERIGVERFPVVVFVTAYDEYALRAFEVHALDYLLKPFSDARLAEALASAKARVRERRACALGQQIASLLGPREPGREPGDLAALATHPFSDERSVPRKYLEHFMVRVGGKVTLLRVEDLDWIEADDYCAKLHTAGRSCVIRETMQRLEARLDPTRFVRVHRSSIVHIDRLRTLEPYIKGSHILTLQDGTRLTLSRGRRAAFEAAIGGRV